ncbi:MAG: hypothetical protein EA417_11990 [Gammaproteobacteria bacterium]|nr:MAG: hypothetical protein EA417_11990 [Gammaproteobacteria bacterium]
MARRADKRNSIAGDCFEAAARRLMEMEVPKNVTVHLVHGLVTGSIGTRVEGLRFTHGWLEVAGADAKNRLAVDYSNGRKIAMPATLYYLIGDIREEETIRYTQASMRKRLLEFRHFGPWEGAPAAHQDPVPNRRRCAP